MAAPDLPLHQPPQLQIDLVFIDPMDHRHDDLRAAASGTARYSMDPNHLDRRRGFGGARRLIGRDAVARRVLMVDRRNGVETGGQHRHRNHLAGRLSTEGACQAIVRLQRLGADVGQAAIDIDNQEAGFTRDFRGEQIEPPDADPTRRRLRRRQLGRQMPQNGADQNDERPLLGQCKIAGAHTAFGLGPWLVRVDVAQE
jgi:hypothetical protein